MPPPPISTLEFHVMLALAPSPLYGYAIRDAVEAESGGTLTPPAGSLYRVIARLMADGFVREAPPPADEPPHPGHARRYYALTAPGRKVLGVEAERLKGAARVAEKRLAEERS